MNNEKTLMKLPLGETLKRTFVYVWKNKNMMLTILPILLALVVVEVVLTMTSSCSPDVEDCSTSWQNIAISLAFIVFNIGIIINYCRHIVLKDELDFVSLSFWKSVVFYCLVSIALGIFLAVPVILLISALAVSTGVLANVSILVSLIYLILFVECILISPLFLVFPSIAVKDWSLLSIKRLFRLVHGNHNRVFWGMIAASLPCFLFLVISAVILFGIYGTDVVRNSLSFWLLGIVIQTINTCIKGSYYAHIYQFFKFVEKKEKL